jgi:hypothetical protein
VTLLLLRRCLAVKQQQPPRQLKLRQRARPLAAASCARLPQTTTV